MKLVPVDDAEETAPKLKLTPIDAQEEPVVKKPQESFAQGFFKSLKHKALSDYSNTLGAFGSELNPFAQYAKSKEIPIPADIAAKYIKDKAGTIDETQPGTSTGAFASDVLTTLPLGAEKLAGNLLLGGAHGFLTGNDGDRTLNSILGASGQGIGHLLGQGVKYAGEAGVKQWRHLFPNTEEIGHRVSDLTKEAIPEAKRAGVLQNLQNVDQYIPGYEPIAAEAGKDTGLNALSKYGEGVNPGNYGERELNNMQASHDYIQNTFGTKKDLKDAIDYRKTITKPLYDYAEKQNVQITPDLVELFKQPNMKDAVRQGITNLRNTPGVRVPTDLENQILTGVRRVDSGLLDANGKKIINEYPVDITGQHLDFIKKAMKARLGDTKNPLDAAEKIAHKKTYDLFDNWMMNNHPDYNTAESTYRLLSEPVNQKKVGQIIKKSGYPAINDFGQVVKETPGQLTSTLTNPKTAKSATGLSKDINDILTPMQQKVLNDVGKNMNRKELSNIGVGGDFNTGTNTMLARAPGAMAQQVLPIPGLYQLGASGILEKMTKSNRKIKQTLADALLNPDETAKFLSMTERKKPLASWNGRQEAIPGIMGYILSQQYPK